MALNDLAATVQPAVNEFYDKASPNYGGITADLNNELLTAVQEVQAQGIRGAAIADELQALLDRLEQVPAPDEFCPWYTQEALSAAGVRERPEMLARLQAWYGCVGITFAPGP